jgi:hypothetical protein
VQHIGYLHPHAHANKRGDGNEGRNYEANQRVKARHGPAAQFQVPNARAVANAPSFLPHTTLHLFPLKPHLKNLRSEELKAFKNFCHQVPHSKITNILLLLTASFCAVYDCKSEATKT